jgi:DNA-directed RNA polymerase specialized sigma subunit
VQQTASDSLISEVSDIIMHGYTQKSDDKNDLINKNMNIVKKISYYYLGRVHQVIEVEDLLQIGMLA